MKNLKKGNILLLAAVVLSFINCVLYVLNMNASYYKDMNGTLVCLAVLSFAAPAAAFFLGLRDESKGRLFASDVLRVAAAALLAAAGGLFISMRVESFGYIFGSNLEIGNKAAFAGANQAVAAIVLFVITWIVTMISGFFRIGKKEV